MKLLRYAILLLLPACLNSGITAGSGKSSSILGTVAASSDAQYKVFYYGVDGETLVAQLTLSGGSLLIPSALLSGTYADRSNPEISAKMDLWMKVYDPNSADFYFESPVLGKSVEINNSATALSWIVKYGFGTAPKKLSRTTWEDLLRAIEIDCSKCANQSASEITMTIRNDAPFIQKIKKRLEDDGNGPLVWNFIPPDFIVAHSNPTLNGLRTPENSFAETQPITIDLQLVSLQNSRSKIFPESWTHYKESNPISTVTTEQWKYTFSFDDEGNHAVSALYQGVHYDFVIKVSNSNRLPLWQGDTPLFFRANKLGSYDLNTRAADPDGLALTFGFAGTPLTGMTIDSQAGILRWAARQAPETPDYLGEQTVRISAIDSEGGSASGNIPLFVTPDNLPTAVGITTDWYVNEGSEAVLDILTADVELDAVIATFDFDSSILQSDPDSAGWNIKPYEITGARGSENIRVYYTPSFLQTILQDQVINMTVTLNYNLTADSTLQYLNIPNTYVVRIHVVNIDDPPQWTSHPQTLELAETVAFTSKPPMGIDTSGNAIDVGPNTSAVTYSLDSTYEGTSSNCLWGDYVDASTPYIAVDSNTGEIHGIPSLSSPRECIFRIRASDTTGLSSYSEPFTYVIADFNQPPSVIIGAVDDFETDEGRLLTINMLDLFDDADATRDPVDPTENLVYTCLNCPSDVALSFSSNTLSWTPSYIQRPTRPVSGIYDLDIRVTDKSGLQVQTTIHIKVNEASAPATIDSNVNSLALDENQSGNITFTVSAFSNSPVDAYTYNYTIRCQNNCRSGFYSTSSSAPAPVTTNNKTFTVSFTPNFIDGDDPSGFKDYNITMEATSVVNPLITRQKTVSVRIRNVNRPPTSLGLGLGTPSYGSTDYTIIISTVGDTKQPNGWIKKYTYVLGSVDEDLPNEAFVYTWGTSNATDVSRGTAPGAFKNLSNSQQVWEFSLPSCVSVGAPAQYVERVFVVRSTDSANNYIERRVKVRINQATATPTPFCM